MVQIGVCEINLVVNTQLHNFYGRSFACVLYFVLMKDIGRWLPWMLSGSTGLDDFP